MKGGGHMDHGTKREAIREHIKSAVLVLLFALMILFSALYFVGTQSAMISPDLKMPLDRLLIIKKGDTESSLDVLDPSDHLPEMIAYRIGTDGGALVANRDLMRDFSRLFGEYYSYFFTSGSTCGIVGRSEGETAWKQIIDGESYLYVRYPGEIPYPLIYAFYTPDTTAAVHADGDITFICELLIDLDGGRAVSRDKIDTYAVFEREEADTQGSAFNLSAISAYNENKSFSSFRMSSSEDAGYAFGIPIPEGDFSANLLLYECADPTTLFAASEARNSLLKMFDFNPDNPRSYDDNGSTVYIENHGTLILSPDGSITYEASVGSGISLANVLGYSSYDGEYTMIEAMTAACGLGRQLTELSPEIAGTAADLQLSRITSDDREESAGIRFIFSYFCNNIPISTGSEALSVTIEGNRITSVRLLMHSYTDTLIAESMLPLSWLESNLFNLASVPNAKGRCMLTYSVITGEGENRQIGCGWSYIRPES